MTASIVLINVYDYSMLCIFIRISEVNLIPKAKMLQTKLEHTLARIEKRMALVESMVQFAAATVIQRWFRSHSDSSV